MKTIRLFAARAVAVIVAMVVVTTTQQGLAQSFSSGSDGSDGPLTVPPNLGTVLFDPTDAVQWGRVLDPDGDGVYNFTTITIGSGSYLWIRGDKVIRPVYWLASGAVVVSGTISLEGQGGTVTTDVGLRRQTAIPGAGGFAGGAGGGVVLPATPGDGPGGGGGGTIVACQGNGNDCGAGGVFTGNSYLIPLIGGSGGGGGRWKDNRFFSGGAGGGAILLASSASIGVTGQILAFGGAGSTFVSGGGGGGAIRLVAPSISGSGILNVNGGTSASASAGGAGRIRLESFTGGEFLTFAGGGAFVTRGSPVDPQTLRPTSQVRVTAIGGVPVPANASGSFVVPDVAISSDVAVPVSIEANGIPPGTVLTLVVYPQSPTDSTVINLPAVQATLAGTTALSTATIDFSFPYGFSRGFLRATWVQ